MANRKGGARKNGEVHGLTVKILGKIHQRLGSVVEAQQETDRLLEHVDKRLENVERAVSDLGDRVGAQTKRMDSFLKMNYGRVSTLGAHRRAARRPPAGPRAGTPI